MEKIVSELIEKTQRSLHQLRNEDNGHDEDVANGRRLEISRLERVLVGLARLRAASNGTSHNGNGVSAEKVTPEIREWAVSDISEEQLLQGIKEIRETGGIELSDFLLELVEAAYA